uniref:Uncharacterized protein n=1 Tax=Glossina palpalis gambiensis TaxID=67801 RepID=A0A1B0BEL6_9MUSC
MYYRNSSNIFPGKQITSYAMNFATELQVIGHFFLSIAFKTILWTNKHLEQSNQHRRQLSLSSGTTQKAFHLEYDLIASRKRSPQFGASNSCWAICDASIPVHSSIRLTNDVFTVTDKFFLSIAFKTIFWTNKHLEQSNQHRRQLSLSSGTTQKAFHLEYDLIASRKRSPQFGASNSCWAICDASIPVHSSIRLTNDVFTVTDKSLFHFGCCGAGIITAFAIILSVIITPLTLACSTNTNSNFENVISSPQLRSLTPSLFSRARFFSIMTVHLSIFKLFLPSKPHAI